MANADIESVAHRLVPILDWIPRYRREWLLPDVFCRRRTLGSHGARGHGLCWYCRCAADHGPLHNSSSVARLRATRHVAAAFFSLLLASCAWGGWPALS